MKKTLFLLGAMLLAGYVSAKPVFQLDFKTLRSFDGKKPGITLKNSRLNNPEKGMTVMAVLRQKRVADKSKKDVIVQRGRQFLVGYDADRIYVDFYDGKAWNIKALVKAGHADQAYHAVALTTQRINDVSQGDNYLQVKLYFDGELIFSRNFTQGSVPDSASPVTVGWSEKFGRLSGDMVDVCGYNRVLTLPEIQRYTARFKQIRNRPGMISHLSDKDLKLLAQLPQKGGSMLLAASSAIRNLAESGAAADWRKAARLIIKAAKSRAVQLPEKACLKQYKIQNAILTVVTEKDKAAAVSLYDTIGKRELLCRDNPWFRVNYKQQQWSALSPGFKCDFKALGRDRFELCWQSPVLTAKAVFDCKDVLAYTLEVRPSDRNGTLQNVEYPALELRSLSGDGTLFSPILSGVAQPEAIKNNQKFECIYPRAFAAMQYGAFYDDKSGVYWSSADPLARVKMLYHTTARDRIKVRYQWTPAEKSPFVPGCSSRVAVFSGHWYEAAMLYRKQIWEIKARWLPEKGLPRTDVAPWFRDNLFWATLTVSNTADLHALKAMRSYMGLPFAISLYRWNSLVWDRDYPHHKSQPEYLEYLNECHRLGLRAIPYINGRLWEEKDRREHDYLYTKIGKANCVMNQDGTIAGSRFNNRKFGIICPFTDIYEKMMQIACNDAILPGADGVYVDQIGAAAHILCYDRRHGHAIPDDTAWFIKGHDKVFSKIRAKFKALDPDLIFNTEDNAETCVRNFDGLETWRWTYDHQVPAFPAVYSGYSQFAGISFNRKYPEAYPAILAWQLISGAHLGWLSPNYFTAPEQHELRVWAKKLVRLRLAMLDFFNGGIMARPVEFLKPVPARRICWGVHGTGWVTTPDVYTSSWNWDGVIGVTMLNIVASAHRNTAQFTLPGKGKYTLYRFSSCGKKERRASVSGTVKIPVDLAPRSFELMIAVPEGKNADRLLAKVRGQFQVIAKVNTEKDPFLPDKNKPVAVRDEESGFLRIDGGHYRCLFMRGCMFPINFMSDRFQELGKLTWNDCIRIGGKNYSLYVDRYAEQKIIENTPEKLIIECTGTMCARAREEEPPIPVKAVYTYTFVKNRPQIEVTARVELGEGKEKYSAPELLQISRCSHIGRLYVETQKMVVNGKTFTRSGKLIVK